MATKENLNNLKPYIIATFAVVLVGAIGSRSTILDDGWYAALNRPFFLPPNWVFPVAWTTLYVLFVIAAGRVWNRMGPGPAKNRLLAILIVNAGLNILWSVLFFTLKRPDWALIEMVPLWVTTFLVLPVFWQTDRLAGALYAPYLAWVSFAFILNAAMVWLNWPF